MPVRSITELKSVVLDLSIAQTVELVSILDWYDLNMETPKKGVWDIRNELFRLLDKHGEVTTKLTLERQETNECCPFSGTPSPG